MNLDFENQMMFVRERNKVKYENNLMKNEDVSSQKAQHIFRNQRERELQQKLREQEMQLEQIRIQEQMEKERYELELFVENYVMNKIQRSYDNSNINFINLRTEAENIFYERLLKNQQDEEYNRTLMYDMRNRR